MAEPEKTPREVAEVVESAMREFHEAMKLREALSIRIGTRTTQIIRFGMIGMVLLMALMFHLILTLTSNLNDITDRMISIADDINNMNKNVTKVSDNVKVIGQNFIVVSDDLKAMRLSVDGMHEHIQLMDTMSSTMVNMKDSMLMMSSDMKDMNNHLADVQNGIGRMSTDMANLSYQLTNLTGQVGGMEHNVDRMVRPLRMIPFP
jgi:archaellum component FlaC